MATRSKRYTSEVKGVTQEPMELKAAVEKIKSFKTVKFDQSVDLVIHLGVDPKQSDQMVRGAISLPNGIGKQKKVIAFCEDSDVEAAIAAGAIEAGNEALVQKVTKGWMDFDVAIAAPRLMGQVGKLGRVLGPQGKMPSPKNGTVTADVANAVKDFAAGKVEFRNDAGGNIHATVGRQSFETQKLIENIEVFLEHIKKVRPASTKGHYIIKVCLSATMTPAVVVAV